MMEMTREEAIKCLDMFLDKQCDLKRTIKRGYDDVTIWDAVKMAYDELCKLPSTQPDINTQQCEPCEVCKGLYNGDTLYAYSDWDGGVGFDYIRDVQYCPVCGRRLSDAWTSLLSLVKTNRK